MAVGVSVGGLHVRALASTHRNRSTPFARLVPLAGRLGVMRLLGIAIGHDYPDTAFRTHRFSAFYEELAGIPESDAQVKAFRRELQIPVVVITAGLGTETAWRAFQLDQTTLSRRSWQIIAEHSGHAIPLSQPEAIVRSIRAAWDAARSDSAPNSSA